MKKIVALAAIASLACGMIFADDLAVANEVVDFKGEAKVSWGLDLDAGQHGFANSEKAEVKVKLWGETTKVTEGEGTWAELKIKTTEADLKGSGDTVALDGGKMSVEAATLHFDKIFVGIRSGSTKVGEFKPNTAVHSDVAVLNKAGLDFANGIQAGYDADEFKFSLDFRSYKGNSNYTSAYGIAVNGELKDNLVPGLTASAGLGVNLSQDFKDVAKDASISAYVQKASDKDGKIHTGDDVAKNTVKGENDTVADHAALIYDSDKKTPESQLFNKKRNYREMAYAAQAAYKLAIGDDMFLKPSVGFRGTYSTWTNSADKGATATENELAAGVLFGWGDINKDANAGVPYLDGDPAKKVTPGVGVVVYIPFDKVGTEDTVKTTTYGALKAAIAPSFYLGGDENPFVPGLNAAAYGEIAIFQHVKAADQKKSDKDNVYVYENVKENETTGIAFTAGLTYKITLDNDATVTPKAGFRYANGAYVANEMEGKYSDVFKNLGMQKLAKTDADKKTFDGDFFNLKAGVDIGGLINNTTFSVDYVSANLSNGIDTESNPAYKKDTKYYNVKMGTLDVSCKIAF